MMTRMTRGRSTSGLRAMATAMLVVLVATTLWPCALAVETRGESRTGATRDVCAGGADESTCLALSSTTSGLCCWFKSNNADVSRCVSHDAAEVLTAGGAGSFRCPAMSESFATATNSELRGARRALAVPMAFVGGVALLAFATAAFTALRGRRLKDPSLGRSAASRTPLLRAVESP